MSAVPHRELRRLLGSMAAAQTALDEGRSAAIAAYEAGRFDEAARIALSACQDVADAFAGVTAIQPTGPPKHARRGRKR